MILHGDQFQKGFLGDLFDLEYGSGLPERVRSGVGYPVFGSNGIVGRHSDFLVQGPGIVVGRKGSVGEVCWSTESFWPIDTAYYVVPKRQTDFRWLFWLLSSMDMKSLDAATGVPGLNRNDVYEVQAHIPEVAEQSRIAAVLDTVDEAIAKTEAVIAKLKQVRAGLLHDLLTRGLDENGQLRDPIAHPEQFQDLPIGRISRRWEISRLGGCSSLITSGSRGWAAHYRKDGPMFLRIGNLTREHINLRFDDVVRVCPPTGSEGARTKVEAGDILISITADLGIIGVIPSFFGEAYVNQHIALIRPNRKIVSRWLGRFLASGPGAKQFQMLNDTGAKAGLNLPAVESLLIAVPAHEEQLMASQALDAIDADIDKQIAFAEKLCHIKSALMADLLTGRVRVPADIFQEHS